MRNKLSETEESIERYEQAFKQLKSALRKKKFTSLERSGLIKYFEFVYELSWKSIKKILFITGIEANSPREAFRSAVKIKLIENPKPWIAIIEDRNLTVHTYNEDLSKKMIRKIRNHEKHFGTLLMAIKNKLGELKSDAVFFN